MVLDGQRTSLDVELVERLTYAHYCFIVGAIWSACREYWGRYITTSTEEFLRVMRPPFSSLTRRV